MDEEDDYNDEETKTYRDNRFEDEGGKKTSISLHKFPFKTKTFSLKCETCDFSY